MKKTILLIISLVFITLAGKSQYFSYGGKLGLGFPGFQDARIASQRITPTFGVTGAFNASRSIVIQTELGYERKGDKYTNQYWDQFGNLVDDSVYDVQTNLDYLVIPLYLKVKLGGANKFYFQAGGYYGYLMKARYSGMRFGEMLEKEDVLPGFARHDYGLVFGGGIETPVRRELSLLLDVKYNLGMTDINVDPTIIGHSDPIKNKSFLMCMGLVILVD